MILATYAPDFSDPVARVALSLFNEQVRDAVRKTADDHPDLRVVVADAYAAFKVEADKFGGKSATRASSSRTRMAAAAFTRHARATSSSPAP